MACYAFRVASILLCLQILFSAGAAAAPKPAPQLFPIEQYEWAYGRIIDTVVVEGNARVRDIAVLRELESRVGRALEASALERDQTFIGDLGVFASVKIVVEPVGSDRCALRVIVTERPVFLLRLVYPVAEYDFNNKRFKYGLKWQDRNFRKHLENFSVDAVRDSHRNDSAAMGWSTGWLGWKHIGAGLRGSYYRRDEHQPTESVIVEQSRFSAWTSRPLTDSRIRYSTIVGGVSVVLNRLYDPEDPSHMEVLITPSLGYQYDSRDSRLKPRRGTHFLLNVDVSHRTSAGGGAFYLLRNVARTFLPLDDETVLGLYSNFATQLKDYPDYVVFGLGGSGTLRGYEGDVFRGAHRWIQTAEIRITPWPKRIYQWPMIGPVDFTFSLVAFADAGIVWTRKEEFSTANYHGGGGFGLRVYSPLQDVVRLDIGFDRRGKIRPYFSTGIRF